MIKFKNDFKLNDGSIISGVLVTINKEDINHAQEFANKVSNLKPTTEKHHLKDNQSEYRRHFTGILGELALEQLLNEKFIDWSIGESRKYHIPDLSKIGLNVGIKTVEYGKAPVIFKKPKNPEIIVLKSRYSNNRLFICGIASIDVLKLYQDDNLILDKNLRERGTKTGFTGLKYLIPFKDLYELSEIVKDLNEEQMRRSILNFLQWNDNNGCYTDVNCDLEGVERLTYNDAVKYFFGVINDEFYYSKVDNIFELTYDKVIEYAKQNGFYNTTMDKLEVLYGEESPTDNFYKKLI